MRKALIELYDLKIGDMLVKYSQVDKEIVHKVTKIDLDNDNEVFYIYTDNTSWYFTINYNASVSIMIN